MCFRGRIKTLERYVFLPSLNEKQCRVENMEAGIRKLISSPVSATN